MSNVNVSKIIISTHKSILTSASCTEGQVELYSGTNVYTGTSDRHGNLLVCFNGTWGKVCGQGNSVVDNNLASVICTDMGYSPYGIIDLFFT